MLRILDNNLKNVSPVPHSLLFYARFANQLSNFPLAAQSRSRIFFCILGDALYHLCKRVKGSKKRKGQDQANKESPIFCLCACSKVKHCTLYILVASPQGNLTPRFEIASRSAGSAGSSQPKSEVSC